MALYGVLKYCALAMQATAAAARRGRPAAAAAGAAGRAGACAPREGYCLLLHLINGTGLPPHTLACVAGRGECGRPWHHQESSR
eukprot:COSAG05_NODE_869_length_6866_cov_20.524457_1_plen_84_part_00